MEIKQKQNKKLTLIVLREKSGSFGKTIEYIQSGIKDYVLIKVKSLDTGANNLDNSFWTTPKNQTRRQ